jgi:hypothetical protein
MINPELNRKKFPESEEEIIERIIRENASRFDSLEIDSGSILIRQEAETESAYLDDPVGFIEAGIQLKKPSEKYPNEAIFEISLSGIPVIAKRIDISKTSHPRKEWVILVSAEQAGLPGLKPISMVQTREKDYLLTEKKEAVPLDKFITSLGEDKEVFRKIINEKILEIISQYRSELNIDKNWHLKDFLIKPNLENPEQSEVIPLDWERADLFDEQKPKSIELVE